MYHSHYHHLAIQLLKRTCINYIINANIMYVNNDVSAFQTCMAACIVPSMLNVVASTYLVE